MDFSALIQALQNPKIYPDHPTQVEIIQTHISAIFLTGEHAYKIKKPVDYGFLDFSTLEKRKFYCQREVELNRRLSPEVYLGVVEIRCDGEKVFLGEGPGEVVEYAVFMKQLPSDGMLDRWLSRGMINSQWLKRIAEKIARFHSEAATRPEISRFGEIDMIRGNIEENFSQTEKYLGRTLAPKWSQDIQEECRRFMKAQGPLFRKRIATGKIRDCHGDLHLQHICLGESILIFDCIEFNERFRYSDVAADIAFLLMDLDVHGYGSYSAELAADYLNVSRDRLLYRLLDFYKSYRAYIRGKVISFRLDDPNISRKEKGAAIKEAKGYFRLAHHYAMRLNRPLLVVTCGLMGTGKSTMARALAETLDWEHLSSDVIRKELAGLQPHERRWEKFHEGIYAPDVSEKTYQCLLDRARPILQVGRSVILDASFKKKKDRHRARRLSRETGAEFLLIECRLAEEMARARLNLRIKDSKESSDGRWEIYAEQKKDFDPVRETPSGMHLPINTEVSAEEGLSIIFRHLLQRAAQTLPRLDV